MSNGFEGVPTKVGVCFTSQKSLVKDVWRTYVEYYDRW